MNQKDRERLRYLASKQLEIANSPKNLKRVALWKRHHALKGERPPIHIEIDTFAHEIIDPQLLCEDPTARSIEYELIKNVANIDLFNDDKVVPPYFQTGFNTWFRLFGQTMQSEQLKSDNGTALGIKREYVIDDLGECMDIIRTKSEYGLDKAGTQNWINILNDIFGDILPVRLISNCLYAVPTQMVVYLMGMENMLYAMYDYPDEFKEMMNKIADDYIEYFKFLENESAILQTNSFEFLGQGSMCFWEEETKDIVRTEDVWGFMDSQETVSISPDMYKEFIYPCYKKISDIYGRLSYGCCEPIDPVWEYVKTFKNLKKVSISPWCNEEYMAEQLKGSGIIYHRKPNPTFLGVGATLDEEAFRQHIEKSLLVAKGCKMEITQRDVYTINRDLNKVKRYVDIIRESIDKIW